MKFMSEEDRDTFIKECQNVQDSPNWGACLNHGYVSRCSRVLPKWTTYYVKLYRNMVIKFYDHDSDTMKYEATELKDAVVRVVERGNEEDRNWPFEFHVQTADRLWKFRTRAKEQCTGWAKCIIE